MKWDYAELSKMASQNGGPEKLVETLIESGKASGRAEGKKTGRLQMLPLIILAGAAAWGYSKYKELKKRKNAKDEQRVEEAKCELINGINEYDANHIDMDKVPEN